MTYLTPQEVADLLKVTEQTVRRWVREGKIPATKFGQTIRIPSDALKPKEASA